MMRKLILLIMTVCLLVCSFPINTFASGGYFNSNYETEDNFDEYEFDKNYVVAFNDFENVTGTFSNGFSIDDTGSSKYGKAFTVPSSNWAAISAPFSNEYIWENNSFNVFTEPLTVGNKYLLKFDYCSVIEPSTTEENAFSLAPKYDLFHFYENESNNDLGRHEFKYFNDGKWHRGGIGFIAEKDNIDLKIATCGSHIKSYIDNYLIIQAAEITTTSSIDKFVSWTATTNNIVDTIAYEGGNVSSHKSYMVAKGDLLKLKFDAPKPFKISVKMGGQPFKVENGVCTISKVTDDIQIDATIDKASLNKIICDIYNFNENNLYLPVGTTLYSLAESLNKTNNFLSSENLSIKRNSDELKINDVVNANDKLKLTVDSNISDEFNIKIAGDINEDNVISVTDMVLLRDQLLKAETDRDKVIGKYDFDISKTNIGVTDLVAMGDYILSENIDIKKYEADIISASGLNVDFTELDKGMYNIGDQSAIANVIHKALRGEEVVIAAFGGSITAEKDSNQAPNIDSGIVDTLNDDSYSDIVLKWFITAFKKYGATFKLINAGIGSTNSTYDLHRMYEDVLETSYGKPDLVIYETIADDFNSNFKATYEACIRKFLSEDTALILYCFSKDKAYETVYKTVADYYNVPMLLYNDAFDNLNESQYLSNDGSHPNRLGHAMAGLLLNRYLGNIYSNINSIDSHIPKVPFEYCIYEASNYIKTPYIAKLTDIKDGKISGVKMISEGSFQRQSNADVFGNDAKYQYSNILSVSKQYYGYKVEQNDINSYYPMVIEVENSTTASILINRFSTISGCEFTVKVNGIPVVDNYKSFNCSVEDTISTEQSYPYATTKLYYNSNPESVTIEILPNFSSTPILKTRFITLYALLLS